MNKYKETANTVIEKFYNGEATFQEVIKFQELQKKAEEEEAEKPINQILEVLKEAGSNMLFLWVITVGIGLGLIPLALILKAIGIS